MVLFLKIETMNHLLSTDQSQTQLEEELTLFPIIFNQDYRSMLLYPL